MDLKPLCARCDPKCGGVGTQIGPKTCRFFGERRRFVAVAVAMLLLTHPEKEKDSLRSNYQSGLTENFSQHHGSASLC